MPPRHKGARADTSLRCPSHRSTRPASSGSAPAALLVDHGQGGLDQADVGLVQDDQDVGVGLLEGPPRLGGVVEAEHRRGGPASEDAAAGVEALGERGEAEGPPTLARGHRVHPEPSLGDDPEGALAAHEQLGQVGAGGRSGAVSAGADDPPVGHYHLQPDDHVLDLPVPVGVLSGAPAGQPAAHGGQVHGLGPVPERDTVTLPEPGLHVGAEGSCPKVGHERVGVHRPDAGQAAQVEGHAPEQRDRRTAHPAAAPGRGHRHPGLMAEGQDGGHLAGVGGAGHHRGPGRHLAGHRPADGQRPPVPSRLGPVLVQRRDPGAHASQPLEQGPVHRHPVSAEVVGHPVRIGVDRRHRRGPDHPGSPPPPVEDPALAGRPRPGSTSRPARANSCRRASA